jgi:hypothetical protein
LSNAAVKNIAVELFNTENSYYLLRLVALLALDTLLNKEVLSIYLAKKLRSIDNRSLVDLAIGLQN